MRVTRASFLALAASAAVARPAFGDIRDDLRILNYVLTLEYVQAALYREALGRVPGLGRGDRTMLGALRETEVQHVDALRATISEGGGRPNERPQVDFGDELRSRVAFLKLANTLEDTSVSALNGAIPQIQNEDFVAAMGSIAQVEARHAATVRLLRDRPPAPLALDKASNEEAVRRVYTRYTV
jgi:hypothetical protein